MSIALYVCVLQLFQRWWSCWQLCQIELVLDLGCGPFHVGHWKLAQNICRWWNLIQFQIIEHRTWKCRWFFCWIELMYWVLVEDYLDWLGVWFFLKGRRNHHCYSKLWIHWYKRTLSESISAFGLHDIEFWHYGEWLHSQKLVDSKILILPWSDRRGGGYGADGCFCSVVNGLIIIVGKTTELLTMLELSWS